MTQLQELRKQAKERGIKGYSVMNKEDLSLALQGKRVPKRLKKNQTSIGTQSDFSVCNECGLKALVTHLSFKADAKDRLPVGRAKGVAAQRDPVGHQQRRIVDGDIEVDAETGEVLGYL